LLGVASSACEPKDSWQAVGDQGEFATAPIRELIDPIARRVMTPCERISEANGRHLNRLKSEEGAGVEPFFDEGALEVRSARLCFGNTSGKC